MLRWILLLIVSAVSALVGLGIDYRSEIVPKDYAGELQSILVDGWVVSGSSIKLNSLFPGVNFVELQFDSWRPANAPPAHLKVSLCDKQVGEFLVTKENPAPRITLAESCDEYELKFEVVNPIAASPKDDRLVGAKLIKAIVSSKIGIPIVNAALLVKVGLALFGIGAALLCTGNLYYQLAGFLAPILGGLILSTAQFVKWDQLFYLWLLFFLAAIGLMFARALSLSDISSEDNKGRFTIYLLSLIFIAGAALRFYGLDFGLPQQFHSDEPRKVGVIHDMYARDSWDPQYFLHPSLLIYSSIAIKPVRDLLGLKSPPGSDYFMAGRTVSALAGALSILLLYLVAAKLFGRETGLLAAAILALLPLHVTCSRYMKEDALLVFNLLLSLFFVVKALKEDRAWAFFVAAFFAGVTASSKYTGALALVPILFAPWFASRSFWPDRKWLMRALLVLPLVPLGFVIFTPYSILNSAKFLSDFGFEQKHMEVGHTSAVDAWSQYWMFHVINSIVPGMTLPVTLFTFFSCGVLLWRRKVEDLLILGLIATFYLPAEWVKAKPAPQPDRYILPCLPFLAIAAAEVVRVLKSRQLVLPTVALSLLLVLYPALRSLHLSSEIKNDTRDRMAQWMLSNITAGSKILVNGAGYAPQFSENQFTVTSLSRTKPLEFSLDRLREGGQEYVILSSFVYDRYLEEEEAMPYMRERLLEIFSKLPLVREEHAQYGPYGFHNPTLRLYSLKDEDISALRRAKPRDSAKEFTAP